MTYLMPENKPGTESRAITAAIHACAQRAKEIARQQKRLLTSASSSTQRKPDTDIKSLTGEQP